MNKLAAGVPIGDTFNLPLGRTKFFGDLVSLGVTLMITISGTYFVYLILRGGFDIIKGAGKTDPQSYAKAKGALTSGVVGFIVVLLAYGIVQIIESITGVNIVTSPGF
jgi:hypothetical protein